MSALPTPLFTDNIPQELRELDQWVCWRYVTRDGKRTKLPVSAKTGTAASSTDPETWASFGEATLSLEWGSHDGIGFVFTKADPFFMVDLDDARDIDVNAEWAGEIVNRFPIYWEVSASGRGLKGIGRGKLPPGGNRKGQIELYDDARFTTITGDSLDYADIGADCTPVLEAYHRELFPPQDPPPSHDDAPPPPMSDEELLEKALRATNGEKLRRLLEGDTTGYSSDSEADAAVAGILKFYTDDPDQIERLMRLSGLQREKWDTNKTYLRRTIENAIKLPGERYEGKGKVVDFRRRLNGDTEELPLDAGEQHLPTITAEAWERLAAYNDKAPANFLFGNGPTRIGRGENDEPIPQLIDVDRLRHEVSQATRWDKWNERAKQRVPAMPPTAVIRDMLAARSYPLPVLHGIVQAPVIGPDGSVSLAPGYHRPSRLFYAPSPGLMIPEIPDNPSPEQIAAAVALIRDELLGDFPFTGDAERAHAIAMLLLPTLRPVIDGPTPLHLIEKPQAGTGAGLLIAVVSTVAAGRGLPVMTEGEDEDEWRKRITALLRTSPTYAVIDNLRKPLDSAAVSAVLTSEIWQDRKLGQSETITLPNRCVWVATGNNPALSAEISRRTIRIRMDAKRDRPWERTEFRHAHLAMWAQERRGELIAACLTLGRAWIAAGKPDAAVPRTLGSFEHWARVMGGVLHTAGIPGFLENLNEFYEASDSEGSSIREFLTAWWQQHGGRVTGVGELFTIASESGLDLGTGNERSQKIRLGKELKQLKDRHYTIENVTVRIASAGTKQGAQQWRLDANEQATMTFDGTAEVKSDADDGGWA